MGRSDSPVDPDIARVGRAVTARRLEQGMETQKDLAARAGVALNTAAFLERGRTFPRQANARKIELALEWPPGTLESLLREQDEQHRSQPEAAAAPTVPAGPPRVSTSTNSHTLAIARAVVAVATTAMDSLLRHADDDPAAHRALEELDHHLLALETVIAASLPHAGGAFDETQEAVTDVHRQREALKADRRST